MGFYKALADFRKDQPGVGDVHIDSSSNRKKPKPIGKFSITVPISKAVVIKEEGQPDKNLVFGWAQVIEKGGKEYTDVQGDRVSPAELEAMFYDFVKNARAAGVMHADYGHHLGQLVECMVFTKEKQEILKIDLGLIGAWVGFEVTPEVFAKVKDGTYPAFSIGGSGVRTPED